LVIGFTGHFYSSWLHFTDRCHPQTYIFDYSLHQSSGRASSGRHSPSSGFLNCPHASATPTLNCQQLLKKTLYTIYSRLVSNRIWPRYIASVRTTQETPFISIICSLLSCSLLGLTLLLYLILVVLHICFLAAAISSCWFCTLNKYATILIST
jgi:hypothetical protein